MKSSKVARRYARALLGLATETAQLESWGAELEKLAKIIESPEIGHAFASPEVAPSAKTEALTKIGEKLDLSYPVRSFAAVVARHSRVEDVPAIAEAYRQMLDDRLGRARATLTFPQSPADDMLARILDGLAAIANKKIIPTINLDPALIGGVVVDLEGKTYDGSLATRLAAAAHRLAG
jgi:F-type H+-transporting ATPase subunit delta